MKRLIAQFKKGLEDGFNVLGTLLPVMVIGTLIAAVLIELMK